MNKRKNYRYTIWLQGPIGRRFHAVFWRIPWWKSWSDRRIWTEMERDENFMEEMRKGNADMEAGRLYRMEDDDFIPDERWRPDDPQQPDGWHHDGERWVRDE